MKLFLSKLNTKYRDFATLEFLMAARIGEVAGLHIKNIDLENRILIIKEVIVWANGNKAIVKSLPKNGKEKRMYISDSMLEIIKRRIELKDDNSPFLFSKNNRPYQYNLIEAAYNRAWKKAGLSQFSGSHLLRYVMCQVVKQATGSIEEVKKISGHKSHQMAIKYSSPMSATINQETMIQCEDFFNAA